MDAAEVVSIHRSVWLSAGGDSFASFRPLRGLGTSSTIRAIFAIYTISSLQRKFRIDFPTRSWLYSRLKRARRFSGLLALFLAAGARDVPAIKRDHYFKG
jgi:hypothetical protein